MPSGPWNPFRTGWMDSPPEPTHPGIERREQARALQEQGHRDTAAKSKEQKRLESKAALYNPDSEMAQLERFEREDKDTFNDIVARNPRLRIQLAHYREYRAAHNLLAEGN